MQRHHYLPGSIAKGKLDVVDECGESKTCTDLEDIQVGCRRSPYGLAPPQRVRMRERALLSLPPQRPPPWRARGLQIQDRVYHAKHGAGTVVDKMTVRDMLGLPWLIAVGGGGAGWRC